MLMMLIVFVRILILRMSDHDHTGELVNVFNTVRETYSLMELVRYTSEGDDMIVVIDELGDAFNAGVFLDTGQVVISD